MILWLPSLLVLAGTTAPAADAGRQDVLVADFEGDDYGAWKATGEAFGAGPAKGTLPGQMAVTGFRGKGLVNSFHQGDRTTGTLTSPPFRLERKRLNFLIGGGGFAGETCINLRVDGKVVRTATGPNREPGGSEHLRWHSWDVGEFAGRTATLEIVDKRTGGWGHINVDHIVQSDREPPDEREELLAQAEAGVKAAAARVKDDPARPVYHVLPPARWLNDPNGPLFHKGYYHLFYQHNPYGDDWGHMHWGHVRSKDLAHWEHLPIALWPSRGKGEQHVFSGCAARDAQGRPMLFYTSIGHPLPEQWAAVPEDDDLVRWKKHPANPLLTEKLHGDTKVHEWRDPYVFRHKGRSYMVVGGNLNAGKGGQAVVTVYRAEDDGLTKWQYLGVLFQHPDPAVKNIECPLFFQLDGRWVLIVSPHGPVQYFAGDLDDRAMRFRPRQRGIVDHGAYYAPNCLQEENGRRLLWGWVNGFPAGKGWRHCLSLPRVLSLDGDGRLLQKPAPELARLRAKQVADPDLTTKLEAGGRIRGPWGDVLEAVVRVERGEGQTVGVRLRQSADRKQAVTVSYDGTHLDVAGTRVPLTLPEGRKELTLHVFLDRSLVEVYADGGRVCVSRVVAAPEKDRHAEFFTAGPDGTSTFHGPGVWQLGSAWR